MVRSTGRVGIRVKSEPRLPKTIKTPQESQDQAIANTQGQYQGQNFSVAPNTLLKTIQTPQGAISVSFSNYNGILTPTAITKNQTFSAPINATSGNLSIAGSETLTYQISGKSLVAVPTAQSGTVSYSGTQIGTLTPSGAVQINPNAVIGAPQYGQVGSNSQQQYLGTLNYTPAVNGNNINFNYSNFSSATVLVNGIAVGNRGGTFGYGYNAITNYNPVTGQISLTPLNLNGQPQPSSGTSQSFQQLFTATGLHPSIGLPSNNVASPSISIGGYSVVHPSPGYSATSYALNFPYGNPKSPIASQIINYNNNAYVFQSPSGIQSPTLSVSSGAQTLVYDSSSFKQTATSLSISPSQIYGTITEPSTGITATYYSYGNPLNGQYSFLPNGLATTETIVPTASGKTLINFGNAISGYPNNGATFTISNFNYSKAFPYGNPNSPIAVQLQQNSSPLFTASPTTFYTITPTNSTASQDLLNLSSVISQPGATSSLNTSSLITILSSPTSLLSKGIAIGIIAGYQPVRNIFTSIENDYSFFISQSGSGNGTNLVYSTFGKTIGTNNQQLPTGFIGAIQPSTINGAESTLVNGALALSSFTDNFYQSISQGNKGQFIANEGITISSKFTGTPAKVISVLFNTEANNFDTAVTLGGGTVIAGLYTIQPVKAIFNFASIGTNLIRSPRQTVTSLTTPTQLEILAGGFLLGAPELGKPESIEGLNINIAGKTNTRDVLIAIDKDTKSSNFLGGIAKSDVADAITKSFKLSDQSVSKTETLTIYKYTKGNNVKIVIGSSDISVGKALVNSAGYKTKLIDTLTVGVGKGLVGQSLPGKFIIASGKVTDEGVISLGAFKNGGNLKASGFFALPSTAPAGLDIEAIRNSGLFGNVVKDVEDKVKEEKKSTTVKSNNPANQYRILLTKEQVSALNEARNEFRSKVKPYLDYFNYANEDAILGEGPKTIVEKASKELINKQAKILGVNPEDIIIGKESEFDKTTGGETTGAGKIRLNPKALENPKTFEKFLRHELVHKTKQVGNQKIYNAQGNLIDIKYESPTAEKPLSKRGPSQLLKLVNDINFKLTGKSLIKRSNFIDKNFYFQEAPIYKAVELSENTNGAIYYNKEENIISQEQYNRLNKNFKKEEPVIPKTVYIVKNSKYSEPFETKPAIYALPEVTKIDITTSKGKVEARIHELELQRALTNNPNLKVDERIRIIPKKAKFRVSSQGFHLTPFHDNGPSTKINVLAQGEGFNIIEEEHVPGKELAIATPSKSEGSSKIFGNTKIKNELAEHYPTPGYYVRVVEATRKENKSYTPNYTPTGTGIIPFTESAGRFDIRQTETLIDNNGARVSRYQQNPVYELPLSGPKNYINQFTVIRENAEKANYYNSLSRTQKNALAKNGFETEVIFSDKYRLPVKKPFAVIARGKGFVIVGDIIREPSENSIVASQFEKAYNRKVKVGLPTVKDNLLLKFSNKVKAEGFVTQEGDLFIGKTNGIPITVRNVEARLRKQSATESKSAPTPKDITGINTRSIPKDNFNALEAPKKAIATESKPPRIPYRNQYLVGSKSAIPLSKEKAIPINKPSGDVLRTNSDRTAAILKPRQIKESVQIQRSISISDLLSGGNPKTSNVEYKPSPFKTLIAPPEVLFYNRIGVSTVSALLTVHATQTQVQTQTKAQTTNVVQSTKTLTQAKTKSLTQTKTKLFPSPTKTLSKNFPPPTISLTANPQKIFATKQKSVFVSLAATATSTLSQTKQLLGKPKTQTPPPTPPKITIVPLNTYLNARKPKLVPKITPTQKINYGYVSDVAHAALAGILKPEKNAGRRKRLGELAFFRPLSK